MGGRYKTIGKRRFVLQEEYLSVVGAVIRRLRKEKKWSQGQLAKETGVSQEVISVAENGNGISLETLRHVAFALGARLSALMKFTETEKQTILGTPPAIALISRQEFLRGFGIVLGQIRTANLGLSQSRLAKKCDVLQEVISNAEHGKGISLESLRRIAFGLNKKPSALILLVETILGESPEVQLDHHCGAEKKPRPREADLDDGRLGRRSPCTCQGDIVQPDFYRPSQSDGLFSCQKKLFMVK